MENLSWDLRFLDLAKLVSTWSKDPSTKVGAVIVDNDKRILSVGYNGFPKLVADNERLQNRDLKYKIILHAEENAIFHANRNLDGCTAYTFPLLPCSNCAARLIQVGIKRVVSVPFDQDRWKENLSLSVSLLEEAGVEVCAIDL